MSSCLEDGELTSCNLNGNIGSNNCYAECVDAPNLKCVANLYATTNVDTIQAIIFKTCGSLSCCTTTICNIICNPTISIINPGNFYYKGQTFGWSV